MTSELQEVWKFFQSYILPVLPFVALVLIEMQLMYNRRENEVMFGTDSFNEKIKAFEFTPKEVRTLEKLVRSSKFENKDAVLNSSGLFEAAVSEFYRIRNVFSVRDETLEAIADIFNVDMNTLIDRRQSQNQADSITVLPADKIFMLPLYNSVAAGFGAQAEDTIVSYIPTFISNLLYS